MKLQELKFSQARELRSTDWDLPDDIIRRLKEMGFHNTGSGYFSQVFVNDKSNIVVKVNTFRPDHCWYKFASLTKKIKSPYLPRVVGLKKIKLARGIEYEEPGTFFLAFMEKLEPWNLSSDFESFNFKIGYIIDFDKTRNHGADYIFDVALRHAQGDYELDEDDVLSGGYMKAAKELANLETKYPGIVKTFEFLYDNRGSCNFDLHRGNFMRRGSTPVIVDPFASSNYAYSFQD